MSGNSRVRHERGFSIKFSQALKSIRNGWLAWTDDTRTMVRDCTPAEQWEIQSQLAKQREPMPWAEIPGLRFNHAGVAAEWPLIAEANRLAAEAA